MEDRELTPYCGCAATVERPYETIEDNELTPALAAPPRDDNP